jgi:uncharacterized protein YndB with AHSA1/START domain
MIEFTIEAEIARPPAAVFAFATDPALLPRWQTNTVSAVPEPEGPLRVGSRIREVHRAPGGKEMESVVEVEELKPGRVFALRMVEGALPLDARLTFESVGSGTRLHFRVHGQLTGAVRFAEPLLRSALKRQFRQNCAELKRQLERGAEPAA